MNWYIEVLNNYAVFTGRARRKEYWYFFLFNLIVTFAIAFIDAKAGLFVDEIGLGLLGFLYALAVFIPSTSVTVRRLHDTNRSAWWLLILLIPIIGAITFLIFLVLDSDPNDNKYGHNPKSTSPPR